MALARLIKDRKLRNIFVRDGIVALDTVDSQDIFQLKSVFEEFHQDLDESYFHRFHVGIHHHDFSYKTRLHESCARVLDKYYERSFKDYRRLTYTMQIKGTGDSSLVPLHQDWSLVDEESYSTLTVWITLVDSVASNGAIHAIPGSHLMPSFPRSGTISGLYDHLHEDLLPFMKEYSCKAGTILAFDSRVLHYSPANMSSAIRVSVINTVLPKSAPLLLSFRPTDAPKSPIARYNMPDNFHLKYSDFNTEKTLPPNGNFAFANSVEQPEKVNLVKFAGEYRLLRYKQRINYFKHLVLFS